MLSRARTLVAFISIVFLCQPITWGATQVGRQIGLYIHFLGPNQLQTANFEFHADRFERLLHLNNPDLVPMAVHARSSSELAEELKGLPLSGSDVITHILILSHGNRQDHGETFDEGENSSAVAFTANVLTATDQINFVSKPLSDISEEAFTAEQFFEYANRETLAVFEPVRRHMGPHVEVQCEACSFVSKEEDLRSEAAATMAQVFGIKNGRFYANHSTAQFNLFVPKPFWSWTGLKSKLMGFMIQFGMVKAGYDVAEAIATQSFSLQPGHIFLIGVVAYIGLTRNRGFNLNFENGRLLTAEASTAGKARDLFYRSNQCLRTFL